MPGWKLWKKAEVEAAAAPEAMGRFNVRPRTDLVGGALPADRVEASKINALRKRRDGVLFDVEQATLAGEADNPWLERVATIDEAVRAVEADLARLERPEPAEPGARLPAAPVTVTEVAVEPSPRVVITIGETELVYVEDLDWAERGFQLARTELHLDSGDISAVSPGNVAEGDRDALREVLGDSLFSLATAARDRASGAAVGPSVRSLDELAIPDAAFGGWRDVNGSSPRRRAHAVRVGELTAELERLRSERDRELEEMARWRARLPVAQRRLRDVDEQIAAALSEVGGR